MASSEITQNTKIPLSSIGVIAAIVFYVASIKSDLTELRLVVEGRISQLEYRVGQIETNKPTQAGSVITMPQAVIPRQLTELENSPPSDHEKN